jgi:hypothetical protein
MEIIHTIGDSHSFYGWNKIEHRDINKGISINHIGTVTMASFGLNYSKLVNLKAMGVKENDTLVFCFGEVDRRCHLCKPNNLTKYKDIVDYIVDKYFEAIKELVADFVKLNISVFNIVPPMYMDEQDYNNYGEKSSYQYPFIGTNEDVKAATLYTNGKLKEYCQKYNYVYFDVYDCYCDENGFLNPLLKDITIHIDNPVHIIKFINSNI